MNESVNTAMQIMATIMIVGLIAASGGFIWFRVMDAIHGNQYFSKMESAVFAAFTFVPFSCCFILLWVVWNAF